MKLRSNQYEFIKGEVVALFERYNIRCIPISGFELAYKMGIILVPYSSLTKEKLSVAITTSPDGFYLEDMKGRDYVYYNDDISYERMNMTILHEIGHCVLDHKQGSEEEEIEARFFAKYAAAPPPLVHRIKPTCPEEIAFHFCISNEAAMYSFRYYHKWLEFGGKDYTQYERRLLALFE